MKTQVTNFLEKRGIKFTVLPHAGRVVVTVDDAAKARNKPAYEMIKCLVYFYDLDDPKAILACIPGDQKVSMKKLKAATGIKKYMSSDKNMIEESLGYRLGSIPPIAIPNNVDIHADFQILQNEKVNFSSGDPGMGLELSRHDFEIIFSGIFSDITK